MDAHTLAARLAEPSGFASILKGMFKGGKVKKAHAVYSEAQEKGVYDNVELRFEKHESFGYAIMAFSTKGPLELTTRETLAAQAERFPLGTIRYESLPYNTLQPWGWHPRSYDPSEHSIQAIGDPFPGVIVYVAVTGTKGSDRPLVVHAGKDGKDYIYPVPRDLL
jgi:pentatricopeptide repeat protein